jgi:urease alpha subunit
MFCKNDKELVALHKDLSVHGCLQCNTIFTINNKTQEITHVSFVSKENPDKTFLIELNYRDNITIIKSVPLSYSEDMKVVYSVNSILHITPQNFKSKIKTYILFS